MEESNYVTAFQNVLNVFFVLQEEIYLPACLGIDNIDLFASRHIEEFMISSDMEDLIRGENIKISANESSSSSPPTDLLSRVDRSEDDLITHHHVISIGSQL